MKQRIKIPFKKQDEILAMSGNFCCLCRINWGTVFHHIDDDPSNNNLDNLVALCPLCHTRAHQPKNNMTKTLNPKITKMIRNEFYELRRKAVCPQIVPVGEEIIISEEDIE